MMKIGLTGGIASGKSTVSRWLKAQDYPLIDADQLARDVVAPGEPALQKIAATFGAHLISPDGRLDRKALGELIFHDERKRRRLNALLHPPIRQRMIDRLNHYERLNASVVFLDIPLLFEGPLVDWVDKTIVVYVTKATQIDRLMKRNHLSRTEALARIDAQMPLERKRQLADGVINNNGSPEETERQVRELLRRWGIS